MNIRLFVAATACLVVGGPVLAQTSGSLPFSIQLAGAGGPGGLGAPFFVLGGDLYQDPNGSDFPPSPGLIAQVPSAQWDSYVALDPFGPATAQSASQSPDGANGLVFGLSSLQGEWDSLLGVASSNGPFAGLQSVFIARLAVTAGATLDAPMVGAIVENEDGTIQVVEEPLIGTTDRPPNRGGGAAYDFRSTFRRVTFPSPFPAAAGDFGRGTTTMITLDIFDIYLVAVPTPGALALFMIAGFAGARRRRVSL